MRYQKWGKRGLKLVCYSQYKNKPHLHKSENCNNIKPWMWDIENEVINDLFNFSKKQSQDKLDYPIKEDIIAILHRQYEETSKKIKKLYNLYSESTDELLLDETRGKLADIQLQIEKEKERDMIGIKIEKVQKELAILQESWDCMSKKEKKDIIRLIVKKVVVENNKINIEYKFEQFMESMSKCA